MREAELILAVFDGSRAADREDRDLIERLAKQNAAVVAVINKGDIGDADEPLYAATFANVVKISAKDGDGMDRLADCVETLFVDGSLDSRRDAVLTNARQHAAAVSALEAVRHALDALRGGYPIDLSCTDAENAMSSLSELDGRAVSEDIIAQIFSHFCVGK